MQKISLILFFIFCSYSIYAQNEITGVVSAADNGETIPGVSVQIKGTATGTITDISGGFRISATNSDILVISYVGYQRQEILVGDQKVINVKLVVAQTDLDEIVIVGYGTQKKSDLTGAISTVDVDNLERMQVATVDQALQGQVAGVSVTVNSGSPGSGSNVRVRGIGSLNESAPLYVIDGMMHSDMDFLNSNDIASIQVLKDASSTAIYGSRGANGVIIITTKNGSTGSGNAKINFDAYYGVQNFWRNINMCNAEQWAILNNEAFNAAGLPTKPELSDPSSLGEGTYWQKEISNQNAAIANYNLSISGGNSKTTYFMSGNFLDQEGIVSGTDFNRASLRVNANHKANDWLTIGQNLTLVRTEQNTVLEDDEWNNILISSLNVTPVSQVYNEDGSFAAPLYTDNQNPVASIYYNNDTYTNYRTLGNVFLEAKIIEGLKFKTDMAMEYSSGVSDYFKPTFDVSPQQTNSNTVIGKYNDSKYYYEWTNTLNYSKSFGDHSLEGLLGAVVQHEIYTWNGMTASGVPSNDPDIRYISNATGYQSATVNGSKYESKQLSYLARVNYNFQNKYLATVNFRADGSSKFGPDNRWGYFPSFSVGWKLSEEGFMSNADWISNLKLRTGWGQIGNQSSIGAYQYTTTATPGQLYTWDGAAVTGDAFYTIANSEIAWEVSATTNIGLDFAFLNGKVEGSLEYFVKNTSDMLLQVPVPAQMGLQEAPFQNTGSMENKGFELSLTYRENEGAFKYAIGGNFTKINNEVTSLGKGIDYIDGADFRSTGYITRTVVGKPMAQFYGYVTDGLFQNWEEVNAQTAQEGVAPGDVRYKTDENGELVQDFIGNPLPDFEYAINASCSYKGFDINLFFQGVYGNDVYNGANYYSLNSMGYWNLSALMLNRWTGEGSTNEARYARMNAADANNTKISDRYVEDGSYLRLKSLQLGYTLPASFLAKAKIEKLRFYVNAQNLLTFTKYTGFDPEIGQGTSGPLDIGLDRASYPQARTISFGLSLGF